jgi:hypothetical protein
MAMAEITCDICGARFDEEAALNRHCEDEHALIEREPGMSTQLDGRHSGNIICSHCRADFTEASALVEHMRVAHPQARRDRALG